MFKHVIMAAAAAAALSSTAAFAAQHPLKVSTGPGATRDWKQIDANGDHLVSPDEMQNWLTAARKADKAAGTALPKDG